MVTFVASGLWHGANSTYLIWGFLHGAFQVVGDILAPARTRVSRWLGIKEESFSHRFFQCAITFVLVCFGWIFFRSGTLVDAGLMIQRLFTCWDPWTWFDGSIFGMGLSAIQWFILLMAVLVLYVVDRIRFRDGLRLDEFLAKQNAWFNIAVVLALFFAIIIYGAYGPAYDPRQFIYFQF
jgi:hypothetical protein